MPSPPLSPMDFEAEAEKQHKRVRTSNMDDDHDIDAGSEVLQTQITQEQHLVTAPNMISPFTVLMAPSSSPDASGLERDSTDQESIIGGEDLGSLALKRSRSLALLDDSRALIELREGMPPELRRFLMNIEYCGNGFAIISRDRRHEIRNMITRQNTTGGTLAQSTYRALAHSMYYPLNIKQQQQREDMGPTPYVQDVLPILEWAARCYSMAAREEMWNAMVHVPLLQLALQGGHRVPERQDDVTVELTQCKSARLIKEYLPATEISCKQVGLCFHLNVDSMAQQAIDALRATLPLASINHIDMESLISHPIAVSCESEELGSDGGVTEAKLQTGTWHAAHWKLLKDLIARQPDKHAEKPTLPPFLPAIIVAGHDWSFAATTLKPDDTQVLWAEYPFGHTRDAAGVYKVVCGLQIFKRWAKNDYWPWYRRCVLGLNGEMLSEGMGFEDDH
ncbi:hypothetical protein VM1G_08905 [Cytospora mali]|uniref:PD-(D/E)XK nuclease-like domain-containing protein n=1 Tax=Cytospora mali TaxID=578113 RepID=A0A194WA60_CYTMA|nr:hypothetical protein VM1G_08905 [Valsa mali]